MEPSATQRTSAAAEVLLDLADEALVAIRSRDRALDGVVDLREVVLGELRVEGGSDDLGDLADGGHGLSCGLSVGALRPGGLRRYSRAAAPPMISLSSVVICVWRLRL